jgi:hypothetical protein
MQSELKADYMSRLSSGHENTVKVRPVGPEWQNPAYRTRSSELVEENRETFRVSAMTALPNLESARALPREICRFMPPDSLSRK